MVRRFVLAAALAVVGVGPLDGFHPVGAQDAAPACASELWLGPPTDATGTAEASPAADAVAAPTWLTAELSDACSGEPFALADFAGKTVFVEAMATWCPTCHDQLTRVKEAAAQIPEEERDDIVLVALSSEVGLPPETLAAYAADNDFPFIFAVMSEEMLRTMADDLGREIAVPPATPHLIVAPDGTIGALHTGSASPEEILALFAAVREAPAA